MHVISRNADLGAAMSALLSSFLAYLHIGQDMQQKSVGAECNRNSRRSRRVTNTDCVPSALPAKRKCGSLKESCAVDDCPSMYCRNSQAINDKDFKKCDCCDEVYCANHMDFIKQCCECDEQFCYYCPPNGYCCEYCFEPLCQNCQSGDHQAICVFEQSDSYHPDAPLSEAQKAALVELKDQHGQGALEDMFDCYTC